MRSRILPAVGVSAIALVAAAALAPGAFASHGPSSHAKSATGSHSKVTAGTCYAQNDNDNGVGIVSQNFEATYDIYDAMGADDLKLKKTCKLKTTTVSGAYFNGSGPATSVNVTYYKGGATPGGVAKAFNNASYTDSSGTGNFTAKTKGKIKKGKYWVSVQANLDFAAGGEWGWNTNNTVRGAAGVWQNPGDGFATGCTSWSTMTTCIPSGEGGDDSFQLN